MVVNTQFHKFTIWETRCVTHLPAVDIGVIRYHNRDGNGRKRVQGKAWVAFRDGCGHPTSRSSHGMMRRESWQRKSPTAYFLKSLSSTLSHTHPQTLAHSWSIIILIILIIHQFLRPRPARWTRHHRGSPGMRILPYTSSRARTFTAQNPA